MNERFSVVISVYPNRLTYRRDEGLSCVASPATKIALVVVLLVAHWVPPPKNIGFDFSNYLSRYCFVPRSANFQQPKFKTLHDGLGSSGAEMRPVLAGKAKAIRRSVASGIPEALEPAVIERVVQRLS